MQVEMGFKHSTLLGHINDITISALSYTYVCVCAYVSDIHTHIHTCMCVSGILGYKSPKNGPYVFIFMV